MCLVGPDEISSAQNKKEKRLGHAAAMPVAAQPGLHRGSRDGTVLSPTPQPPLHTPKAKPEGGSPSLQPSSPADPALAALPPRANGA